MVTVVDSDLIRSNYGRIFVNIFSTAIFVDMLNIINQIPYTIAHNFQLQINTNYKDFMNKQKIYYDEKFLIATVTVNNYTNSIINIYNNLKM